MPTYRTINTYRSTDAARIVDIESAPGRHPDRATCSCGWAAHATPGELRKAMGHHFTSPDEWKRFNLRR